MNTFYFFKNQIFEKAADILKATYIEKEGTVYEIVTSKDFETFQDDYRFCLAQGFEPLEAFDEAS